MGLNMTTATDSFLRTIVREERIPYDIRTERAYRETAHREYINRELDKSMLEAADLNTKWLSPEDIVARINERRKVRSLV